MTDEVVWPRAASSDRVCCAVMSAQKKARARWTQATGRVDDSQCIWQPILPTVSVSDVCAPPPTGSLMCWPLKPCLRNPFFFQCHSLRDLFPVESLVVIIGRRQRGTAHTSLASCLSFNGRKSTSLNRSLLNQHRHWRAALIWVEKQQFEINRHLVSDTAVVVAHERLFFIWCSHSYFAATLLHSYLNVMRLCTCPLEASVKSLALGFHFLTALVQLLSINMVRRFCRKCRKTVIWMVLKQCYPLRHLINLWLSTRFKG